MGKIIQFPGKQRGGVKKPPMGQPARFLTEEIHRGRREDHTAEKFVPVAMERSLVAISRWEEPAPKPGRQAGGRVRRRSPSTLRLNNSNVKRRSSARGRAKGI